MATPKRHHYVQRAYLNGFAKNNKVYVLQKRTKTILKNQDTKNVCVIGNHNSITLENLLADNIEKDWEKHLSDIIENKISSDTFSYMAYYSAIQYLRTYFFYLIREVLPPHFPGFKIELPRQSNLPEVMIRTYIDYFYDLLQAQKISICVAQGTQEFITSDSPFTFICSEKYLAYFPLTNKILWCVHNDIREDKNISYTPCYSSQVFNYLIYHASFDVVISKNFTVLESLKGVP